MNGLFISIDPDAIVRYAASATVATVAKTIQHCCNQIKFLVCDSVYDSVPQILFAQRVCDDIKMCVQLGLTTKWLSGK